MFKPENLKTKIFLDSGDPTETEQALNLLGFLDGQTTNPSLIAKNPEIVKRIQTGEKLSSIEVKEFYREVIKKISNLLPNGSVSVEVYADKNTSTEDILREAIEMNGWIPNAHIKLPIIKNGLLVAEKFVKDGGKVNMTLCFNQEQGAVVHSATFGSMKGNVFLSPFIGRLDDIGINGMDLILNLKKMFETNQSHVEILAASVRSYEHFKYSLFLEVDIITAPLKILAEWAKNNFEIPNKDYIYNIQNLRSMVYEELDLNKNWKEYNIQHDLTDIGIDKFVKDWNSLIAK